MIVLDLMCSKGHRFEAWFASRDAFDAQQARGLVQCAICGEASVSAMPAGPLVRRHGGEAPASASASTSTDVVAAPPDAAAELFRALATMARRAEDVGERFPEEARRIHYEEAPARAIRGQATREETRELLEEGIMVLPALLPKATDVH